MVGYKRLLVALVVGWSACAQAELTAPEIEKFMAATQAVISYGEENLKDLPEGEDSVDFTNWSKSMMDVVNKSGHADAITKLVKDAGFDNLEQWANTSEEVMMAMFAALMKEQQPLMEAGLAMLEAMAANPKLSAEDKANLAEQLTSAREALARTKDVPAADVAAITPYLPKLQQMFDGASSEAAAAGE